LAFDDARRTFRPNHLPAHRTAIPMEAILGDLKRILSQLGNLLNLGLPGRFEFAVVPMRATRGMKFLDVVDLVGSKQRAIRAGMSRLAALAARAFGTIGFGRLDDVAGRGLRAIGGVLREASHLGRQFLGPGPSVGRPVAPTRRCGVIAAG